MLVRRRARLVMVPVDDQVERFGVVKGRLVVMVRRMSVVQPEDDAADPGKHERGAEDRRGTRPSRPVHACNITTGPG